MLTSISFVPTTRSEGFTLKNGLKNDQNAKLNDWVSICISNEPHTHYQYHEFGKGGES